MAEEHSKLKLVHITTVPQSLNFVRGQVGYMKNRGFEVEAISSPGQKLVEFGKDQDITVHAVELLRQISSLHDVKAIWRLSGKLRSIKPIIVHAHTPKGGLLGMISAWIMRTPIRIYHIRGLPYMTATGPRRTLLKATERLACVFADTVFCVSHSIREVAIADSIVPADKIVVFAGGSGNGIDAVDRFNPARFSSDDIATTRGDLGLSQTDVVIGYVGRIVRDKGLEELAQAWSLLRESHRNARLVLVGPLEPKDPVSTEAMEVLQKDDRVTMVDWVDDTSRYYPVFDLLCLPTYREGFPNVVLEAASLGIPVVATRIPGCIDAVQDGVTGTLVPVGDSEGLADAIKTYLDNPALRQRHGEAGRRRVLREFRQEIIWEAIYQEYCALLSAKKIVAPET